ncbi:hypothetical protein PM082_013587 [Marasmius tenuissimus]|nr:hypothetical protein PM082_013587 [Marasmius tenuissimus]
MCYAPQVQRKAQAEIDLFSEAKERWPGIQERDQFPYLRALIKEIFRWGVVAPLGIPHRLTEDMTYDNYVIPRDTTIFTNAWAICHDETIYPKPFEFEPERFLGSNPQLDPREFVFGGGKRICPGVDMADTVLFMTLAAALAVLNIKPRPDSPPSYSYQDRMGRHPSPFVCDFEYRSPKVENWIMRAMDDWCSI